MPPAPCPPHTWKGRGAEETLHRRERKVYREHPDRVPCPRFGNNQASPSSTSRPHKDSSELGEVESELQEASLWEETVPGPVRSSSAPTLRPLAPPLSSEVSPFASTLGFLRREPSEFQLHRETAVRREATKLMRQVYRNSIEEMGHKFREEPPWPPKEKKVEHLPVKGQASPLIQMQRMPKPYSTPVPKSLKRSSKNSGGRSGNLSCLSEREETLQAMKSFGRGCVGGPYTVGQIYQEVDADVSHKFPADVRALSGRLGPAVLGQSTTRMRRKLPFTHPFMTSASSGSLSSSMLRAELDWH